MKRTATALALVSILVFSGCYHAKVTTGLTPSAVVYDVPFASSWIYGLVPPSPVEAAEECPGGVAIVETELSFVNQLVGFITFGIYTPMHIKVTCAAESTVSADADTRTVVVARESGSDDVVGAFAIAAEIAVETGHSVAVRFE